MATETIAIDSERHSIVEQQTTFAILVSLSISHLLNDVMQSLIPAVYPLLKENYALSFFQIGMITFVFQLTASLLQPVVGLYSDRHPWPYFSACGMMFTVFGLVLLANAASLTSILIAAAFVGMGSSVFHPEASRIARSASGGRFGFAQALFQVGGNAGSAIGPLLAAFVIVPNGQPSIAWLSVGAIATALVLWHVGRWYENHLSELRTNPRPEKVTRQQPQLPTWRIFGAIAVLMMLMFSKYFYLVSLSNYFMFYLIQRFHTPLESAQLYLFVFLTSVAVGTLGGGLVSDRLGFKKVIWISILGILPFTLVLPHANLFWTVILTIPIGLIQASAFTAMIVYAQELVPGKVGLIGGLFFGFAFGAAGVGAAALGWLADRTSIEYVYHVCAYLPLIGLLTALLPNTNMQGSAVR